MLVHHSQFTAGGTHVQAAHGCGQLQQCDGKWVVNKYFQDLCHKKMREHRIKTNSNCVTAQFTASYVEVQSVLMVNAVN